MLGSHRGDDIHRLGRRNFVASDLSPTRLLQKGFIRIGDIIKVTCKVVKYGHKKEKIKKSFFI